MWLHLPTSSVKTLEETYEQRLYKIDANIKAAAKDKAEKALLDAFKATKLE